MRVDPNIPYQELPPLPPRTDIESKQVLKKAISANSAIARLDAASQLIPDPSVLINTIPLLEAQASSEIENIVTTNDELFKAAHDVASSPTPATKEALRYRSALQVGYQSIQQRPLTANTAVHICSVIRGVDVDIRSGHGTHIGNPVTRQWVYTPPVGKEIILDHLRHWEVFLQSDNEFDPLVKLALLHYQFEAIHPFTDGNGRTGRILNVLYLVHMGVLKLPITYLSGYIVRHKDSYYSLLNDVTQEEKWEEWVLFILDAIESTSLWTLKLIEAIKNLQEETQGKIGKEFPRLPARDLAHVLFTQPYIRYRNLVEAFGINRQTAARWMSDLENAGIVHRASVGRNAVFINKRFLDVLFAFQLPN